MRRFALACGACLLAVSAGRADASEFVLNGSSRADFLLYRKAPPGLAGVVEDGATNFDLWFDTRAFYRNWEASVRFRAHETAGIMGDTSSEEIDRRHVAYVGPDLEVWGGNYYSTFGNGLVLRSVEQRFVTLNRVDRAFNLDRSLDGFRVRGERGPLRFTLLSGTPMRQQVSMTGGAEETESTDLIQGGEGVLRPVDFAEVGFAYVRAELAEIPGDPRETEDLVSYRGRLDRWGWSAELEVAEKRPREDLRPDGTGRYLRVEGGTGILGITVEGKSYRNFGFPHNQPPTLVRTHESVLLNRTTHVLLPDDERGFQTEILAAPGLFTTFLVNLAGSEGADTPGRIYREVYLEGRSERESLGGARLGLDWARDQTKFPQVENRWTAALELERFLGETASVILDLELQAEETGLGDVTRRLLQLGFSRAGSWTVTVTGEHVSGLSLAKRDWLFAALDLRVSENHDLTLGYGSRPAGIVCSGGFCFESPEFDGVEARLLSRF